MTLQVDLPPIEEVSEFPPVIHQTKLVSGRLVSLRTIAREWRRRRSLWIATAIIGLVVGMGYHAVVPRRYTAFATLYVAHQPGSDDIVEIGNDLALLNNTAVAERAIRSLGEPGLDPTKFLGKAPGKALSDNVIEVTMQATSPQEAVRRVAAVVRAYMSFRTEQINAQGNAIASGLQKQIGALESQANTLNDQIGSSNPNASNLTQLVDQRADIESQVTALEQTLAQDRLDTLSVVQASRDLSGATLEQHSAQRLILINSLSGLAAGLLIGLAYVALRTLASDRVRLRDDVATLAGASVEVSALPVRRGRRRTGPPRPRRTRGMPGSRRSRERHAVLPAHPPAEIRPVSGYLERYVSQRSGGSLLLVAVDDLHLPAVALAAAGASLARHRKKAILCDLTERRALAEVFECKPELMQRVMVAAKTSVVVCMPGRGPGSESEDAAAELSPSRWPRADAVLALAVVDMARGASHLRHWDQAVLAVTAGRSSAARISGTAELLRASGVAVVAAVLFDADQADEGVGVVELDTWGRCAL